MNCGKCNRAVTMGSIVRAWGHTYFACLCRACGTTTFIRADEKKPSVQEKEVVIFT